MKAFEMIRLFSEFNEEVINDGFVVVPTQTEFCRWLGRNYEKTDKKTIYNTLNKIFPDIKKQFEQIQSDTVATGAMLGKYQPTMSIFVLKNWCKWKDRNEVDVGEETRKDVARQISLSEKHRLLQQIAENYGGKH